jgi:DNA-binding MarR family transcriptional regulator
VHHERDQAVRGLLTQVGLLGPLRREMGRCVMPQLHESGASVAWHLGRSGPLRMTALAASLQLDLSVVSRQVADLVQAGYVQRQVDENDRRASLLSLTESGQAALDAALDRLDDRFRTSLAGWETDELVLAATLLQRLREELVPRPSRAPATGPDEADDAADTASASDAAA